MSKSHLPRNDFTTSTSSLFHVWSCAKGATYTHIPQEKFPSAHNMADEAPTFLFYINSLRINTGVCAAAAAKLGRCQICDVNFQNGNFIIFRGLLFHSMIAVYLDC